MAKMAESRDGETPGHLRRLQVYTRVLAQQAARRPPWEGLVDERFLEQLERCVPLHDIGKIGLPDDVLLKPGALTASERALVETHPLIGDRILEALGREHGHSLEFLGMARRSCGTITSATTAAATPIDWPATPSRPPRASSPSPTCTTPCAASGRTRPPCRTTRPST